MTAWTKERKRRRRVKGMQNNVVATLYVRVSCVYVCVRFFMCISLMIRPLYLSVESPVCVS